MRIGSVQGRWRSMDMIKNNLLRITFEGMNSRQPLIDDDAEGILIRSPTSGALESFRSNIGKGTSYNSILCLSKVSRIVTGNRNPKITHHYIIGSHHQHILWLHVSMDSSLGVGILQTFSYLIHVRYNLLQRNDCIMRM